MTSPTRVAVISPRITTQEDGVTTLEYDFWFRVDLTAAAVRSIHSICAKHAALSCLAGAGGIRIRLDHQSDAAAIREKVTAVLADADNWERPMYPAKFPKLLLTCRGNGNGEWDCTEKLGDTHLNRKDETELSNHYQRWQRKRADEIESKPRVPAAPPAPQTPDILEEDTTLITDDEIPTPAPAPIMRREDYISTLDYANVKHVEPTPFNAQLL